MKRVLCSALVIALLITALMIPASAATNYYTEEFSHNFLEATREEASYNYYMPHGVNGPINLRYNETEGQAIGYTSVMVPEGGSGWTHTDIFYHYLDANRGQCNTVVNGKITSSAALRTYTYASRVTHVGNQRTGEDVIAWDYYFTDPNHVATAS